MTYPIEASIPMTLSSLQVILYCKPSDVIFARAVLYLRDISCHRVFVHPSQATVVPKWLHVGSRILHCIGTRTL